jgi:hypothetical protein
MIPRSARIWSSQPLNERRNNGNTGETNRTGDAWQGVEAQRDLREGLGTPLATEWERSGGKDCAICNAIWIPSEVLWQRNVRHFRQIAPAKWANDGCPGNSKSVIRVYERLELFLQRFLLLAAESGYSCAAKLGDCLSARESMKVHHSLATYHGGAAAMNKRCAKWLPTFLQRGIHFFGERTEGFALNNFVIFDRVHLPIIGNRAAIVEERIPDTLMLVGLPS